MSTGAGSNGPLLTVKELCAGYGKREIISTVSFSVGFAEIVAVVGPNGAGKSTLLKAIFGKIQVFAGEARFAGRRSTHSAPHDNVSSGMIFLPQGNRTFDDLTVYENLLLGGYSLRKAEIAERIDVVLRLFPAITGMLKRPAHTLSGGEKQMLAFARAMIPEPKLLLLDEPSIGLSPKLVNDVFEKARQIRDETNCSIVIVEQKVKQVLPISDSVLGMKLGKLVLQTCPGEFAEKSRSLFLLG